MTGLDQTEVLLAQVEHALAQQQPLAIVGGNSKHFYGYVAKGQTLSVGQHTGILHYHPDELVITARAGTLLSDISQALAEHKQMLAFEPPSFSPAATLGGTIACGFSGPNRVFAGSARDFVLGCKLINGNAQVVKFGGEVMKNVAGFDVSRLMVGAMGTLGVLLELSLKVLPLPETTVTHCLTLNVDKALNQMSALCRQSLPLSGLCYDGQCLYVRLSGYASALHAASQKLGGEILPNNIWQQLNEQTLPFFQTPGQLWRISLPPATPPLALPGTWFYDWAGGLRWLKTDCSSDIIFKAAADAKGHALLFRAVGEKTSHWQPLTEPLSALNRGIKHAFDPKGIFNPQRLTPDW